MIDPDNPNKKSDIFDQDALIEPPKRGAWKIMLPLSLVLLAVIFFCLAFGLACQSRNSRGIVVCWILAPFSLVIGHHYFTSVYWPVTGKSA